MSSYKGGQEGIIGIQQKTVYMYTAIVLQLWMFSLRLGMKPFSTRSNVYMSPKCIPNNSFISCRIVEKTAKQLNSKCMYKCSKLHACTVHCVLCKLHACMYMYYYVPLNSRGVLFELQNVLESLLIHPHTLQNREAKTSKINVHVDLH